ncbi:dTDP-4-dehydrorhamnose 3,5-epimerase [beta proteobacterium KB13]|uniref:dTDP-4-dehydrorhamnose 3,5-epimerase n=1 Tax=beta proteobacterium KB13 TaxID=314607 RepID=B6BTJ9_9PROT|nr:dTDP-4-dehydrorhamnose 3,5-epimerase [beta proteobacterium KB13]
MKVTSLKIPEVKLIEPDVFEDERGFFYESFNQHEFNNAIGQEISFVQDNQSKSKKGVLRGLHYQKSPFSQGKLVRVISGQVFDVAVDIREGSETYGNWVAEVLTGENKKQLWIPEGFAHGFLSLENDTVFSYKVSNYYSSYHEVSINPFLKEFSITWPQLDYLLSDKDLKACDL